MTLKEFLKLDISELKGKVFCFPTDTVYGLGCLYNDEIALKKIYDIKKRSNIKPLAILVSNTNDINMLVCSIPSYAKQLMEDYWPGALTIIFKKSSNVSNYITCNLDTIGIRMPSSNIALEIINKFGPLPTTSVNISKHEPLNNLEDIINEFGTKIDYIISDCDSSSNVSSTVVDATSDKLVVLRQGSIIIK